MRPLKNMCEVAVIGGGLAGLSAARHAARLGRLVTLFEGSGLYGGQVATVGHVEGMPLPGRFSGQAIAMALLEDAQKVGVRVIEANVAAVDLGEPPALTDEEGRSYSPEAVIVASGALLRKLGVPGEEAFAGRGVSWCATCDGGFFRGRDVVVVGGGDAAVHEALELAPVVRSVTMVCRSAIKAKREYVDKLHTRDNVAFVWDHEVTEILGQSGVEGVRLRNVASGAVSELPCAGVFPFIGVAQSTGALPAALLAPSGEVAATADLATTDPNVFAAGAVRTGFGGTAAEALAEGIGAAHAAARFLGDRRSLRLSRAGTVRGGMRQGGTIA
jgi:thioredoxin reductase (NADPH)